MRHRSVGTAMATFSGVFRGGHDTEQSPALERQQWQWQWQWHSGSGSGGRGGVDDDAVRLRCPPKPPPLLYNIAQN